MTNPMTDTHTAIINAHKAAAAEHRACAEFHLKTASCQEQDHQVDAKDNANKALSCCDNASKQSANACACS